MRTMAAVTAVLGLAITIGARTTAAQAPAAQAPDGQALYRQHCRTCHGATGTPTARMAEMYPEIKPFGGLTGVSADSVVTLLVNGAGKDMKSFKEKLTADEMKAVAQYVLTLVKPATP